MANDEVAIIGAGRTGSRIARLLAGRFRLKIIDRDYLDARSQEDCPEFAKNDVDRPKAIALAEGMPRARGICANIDSESIAKLIGKPSVVVDCTDNYASRTAINRYCHDESVPWLHCGALGGKAQVAAIIPKQTPCFECWAQKPEATTSCSATETDAKTLDWTARQVAAIVQMLAKGANPPRELVTYNNGRITRIKLKARAACPGCGSGVRKEHSQRLCGSNEYFYDFKAKVDVGKAARLIPHALEKELFVRFDYAGATCSLFFDGRMILRAKNERAASVANSYAHRIMKKL